jgi:U3 small nucleolar RNA-associated protein MPP10
MKLSKQMQDLETKNLAVRDWTLMGEISSNKRPSNSLLDVQLEFDHATKLTPVVTQEMTERCVRVYS